MTSWPWGHPLDPPPPWEPIPQRLRAVAVVLPVFNARVYLDDLPQGHVGTTDVNGYVEFAVSELPWTYLTVEADGYEVYRADAVSLPPGDVQIRVGVAPDPARPCDVILGPLVALKPPLVTLPRLIPKKHYFGLETGGRFTVKEASDFNLLARFIKEGEAVVRNVMEDRQALGFNMFRGWTRYGGDEVPRTHREIFEAEIGRLQPTEHPVYDAIPDFLRLAAQHGQYVEFTAYCGGSREDHWERLGEAVQGHSNVLVELINEFDAYAHDIRVQEFSPIPGVLCSHGSAGSERLPPRPPWGYEVLHLNGASEWQRKPHNALELSVGDPEGHVAPSRVPVFVNETTRPDNDSMLEHFEDYGKCGALLAAGGCFHSRSGKRSVVFDDFDRIYAKSFLRGADSVDLAFQGGQYRHGDEEKARERALWMLRCYRRGDSPFVDIRR